MVVGALAAFKVLSGSSLQQASHEWMAALTDAFAVGLAGGKRCFLLLLDEITNHAPFEGEKVVRGAKGHAFAAGVTQVDGNSGRHLRGESL